MTSMFKLVSDMNEAFGNAKGDPLKINGKALMSQCKNIGSEFKELMLEFGIKVEITYEQAPTGTVAGEVTGIRDGLCDIMVFALGAYHRMGYDAERDMASVIEALYTRFCRNAEHFRQTAAHYDRLGVLWYVDGKYPRLCLKSAVDQGDGEYPQGKFLKAVGYRQPTFYEVVPPVNVDWAQVMAETSASRDQATATAERLRVEIDQAVAAYRTKLEAELLGLPPYDPNKNGGMV